MVDEKRIKNWLWGSSGPKAVRPGRATPQVHEPRLWLTCTDNELFFVNGGHNAIVRLTTSPSATALIDEGVFNSDAGDVLEYFDIAPREAVKIDAYDGYHDLDYVLGAIIVLDLGSRGRFACYVTGKKGGIRERVLQWADGTWHSRVTVEPLPAAP